MDAYFISFISTFQVLLYCLKNEDIFVQKLFLHIKIRQDMYFFYLNSLGCFNKSHLFDHQFSVEIFFEAIV